MCWFGPLLPLKSILHGSYHQVALLHSLPSTFPSVWANGHSLEDMLMIELPIIVLWDKILSCQRQDSLLAALLLDWNLPSGKITPWQWDSVEEGDIHLLFLTTVPGLMYVTKKLHLEYIHTMSLISPPLGRQPRRCPIFNKGKPLFWVKGKATTRLKIQQTVTWLGCNLHHCVYIENIQVDKAHTRLTLRH